MRRNECYLLKRLDGVPYLLPFGQAVADRKHSIRLNETGEFLWGRLEEGADEEQLLEACAVHYEASGAELELLREDISHFLDQLTARGALCGSSLPCPPKKAFSPEPSEESFLSVAGINIRLSGPAELLSHGFDPFLVRSPREIHLTVSLLQGPPPCRENGTLLVRHRELVAEDCGDHYALLFPCSPGISDCLLRKDGSRAEIYCARPFSPSPKAPAEDTLREELFHAVRLIFLYLAGLRGMTVIHSASLLYRDRAWLFSGPSGAGKSTHTGLWHRLLGVPLLNGDLNLMALDGETPMIHGIPWCGTSGLCDTHSHPLGGILLLRQDSDDYAEELSFGEKLLAVQQRLITPVWTADALERNLSLTEALLPRIFVCRLHCAAKETAVQAAKKWIDAALARDPHAPRG